MFVPEGRNLVEAALRAVALDAVWPCRTDGFVGASSSPASGPISRDPTAVEPTAIAGIEVSETWPDGVRRHAA